MPENVLLQLPKDEYYITKLLVALCVLKPLREVIVRAITEGAYGADDVQFDDIFSLNTGNIRPDLALRTENLLVLVEIKTDWKCPLQPTQPTGYLTYLLGQPQAYKACVLLAPPAYVHLPVWQARVAAFNTVNPGHGIQHVELNWLQVADAIDEVGLPTMSAYARDFVGFMEEMYNPPFIAFNHHQLQVTDMFNRDAAAAIRNLLLVIDGVRTRIEEAGFQLDGPHNTRWWRPADGEYAIIVSCGQQRVLWFGMWRAYWEAHGCPLCVGVEGAWARPIIARFQQEFPNPHVFPPNGPNPYLVTCVPQNLLLAQDPVGEVYQWIHNHFLNGICGLLPGNAQPGGGAA